MTMEEQSLIAGRRMLDKAKAGLQGPAGFLSEARLEAYLEKLDPARGVSRVRLEAYLGRNPKGDR